MSRWGALLVLLAAVSAGCARHGDGRAVSVREAWVRASTPGASAGAAYLTLRATADDQLVGVEVPREVALAAQVHESFHREQEGGPASLGMRRLERVKLPGGRDVEFAPGRRHVMLVGLARPLVAGERVTLVLRFEHAGPETLSMPIRDE
jgi:copper(I)-binding protein